LRGDALEVVWAGMAIDRDVGTGSGCDRQVSAQDRRPLFDRDVFESDTLASAVAQHGPPAGGAHVAHPVRVLPSMATR